MRFFVIFLAFHVVDSGHASLVSFMEFSNSCFAISKSLVDVLNDSRTMVLGHLIYERRLTIIFP